MFSKKAVIFLVLLSVLPLVFGQTHYFDYGYGTSGSYSGGFNFGFISNLCDSYGEFFEFFVLFVIFFIVGHWAFKGRSKGDTLSIVVAFALAFGLVRWEATRGVSLVCGLGDIFSGLFGGFIGLLFILILILGFFAVLKGSDGARAAAGLAYLLFFFWLQSEGGYQLSSLYYYLPLNPFFVEGVLTLLAFGAAAMVVIFGWRWFQNRG